MKSNAFYFRALLGVLAFTTLVTLLFGRPEKSGRDFWQPSSYNPSERGHKALYATLQELHWPVARWQSPYRELDGQNQVLLLARNALGRREPLGASEIDQLLRWVGAGNRCLLFGDFATATDTQPLRDKLHFHAATSGPGHPLPNGPLLTAPREKMRVLSMINTPGTHVALEACDPLPTPPANARVVLQRNGAPYGVEVPYQSGTVTFLASASLLDHFFLRQDDTMDFLIELLRPAGSPPTRLWFEEAHHGYRAMLGADQILQHPGMLLALGQIAIGVLVFLSAQLFRFGPIRPLRQREGRSTLEFVRSLANLYRRANMRNEMINALFHDTHDRILRKFNLPERTSHEVIARYLAEAFPHLPRWKKLAQRFDSDDYVQGLPPSGWLKVSRELILIKNAML